MGQFDGVLVKTDFKMTGGIGGILVLPVPITGLECSGRIKVFLDALSIEE